MSKPQVAPQLRQRRLRRAARPTARQRVEAVQAVDEEGELLDVLDEHNDRVELARMLEEMRRRRQAG